MLKSLFTNPGKISKYVSMMESPWSWKKLCVSDFSLKNCLCEAFEVFKYTEFFMDNCASCVQLCFK